jgi:membrane-associated phospholipid phosphatase
MDPAFKDRANDLSDIGLLVAPVLPFTLALDKKVRSNFLDYSMMYVEMHAVNSTLYLASTLTIRRKRPFVYNPNVDIEKKEGIKTTDSFFSGHVSVVTSSTFFMTKVFLDHHPELKKKRFLFYSLASIPPIYTAYFRYRAGKHYPSDLIVGYMVGAATGILVPELHKLRDNRLGITAWGMGDAGGLRLTYKL